MKYIRARNLVLAFCSSIWFGGSDCLLYIRVQSGSSLVDEVLMTVSIPWQQNLLGHGEVTNNLLLVATFVTQAFLFYRRTSVSELHLQTLYLWHHIGSKRTPQWRLPKLWSVFHPYQPRRMHTETKVNENIVIRNRNIVWKHRARLAEFWY